jgi:hypothetical protein
MITIYFLILLITTLILINIWKIEKGEVKKFDMYDWYSIFWGSVFWPVVIPVALCFIIVSGVSKALSIVSPYLVKTRHFKP